VISQIDRIVALYLPYILACKPTLKKLPQNEEFCKNSHISPSQKCHGVLFGLITKEYVLIFMSKHHVLNQTLSKHNVPIRCDYVAFDLRYN